MKAAVVIPVGPETHHDRYLEECLDSVQAQSAPFDYVVLVDDMHGLGHAPTLGQERVLIYRPPWRLGVGHAFNHGAAVAFRTDDEIRFAFFLGADDKLEPRACERLWKTYSEQHGRDGYYWLDVVYSDGEEQRLPCNAAAITPGLFERTGGFPVYAAVAVDAALVSQLLVHEPQALIHVEAKEEGRYWVRRHAEQEGHVMGGLQSADVMIRNWLTEHYEPTRWGRYA